MLHQHSLFGRDQPKGKPCTSITDIKDRHSAHSGANLHSTEQVSIQSLAEELNFH